MHFNEITESKKKNSMNKDVKEPSNHERVREKVTEEGTEIIDKISFNPESCSSPKEKITSSKKKVEKDKVKTNESKEVLYTCNMCDYKVKKEDTLKKHMITKHQDHVCKECNKNLPSFMDLLKHVAKEHAKERSGEKSNEN